MKRIPFFLTLTLVLVGSALTIQAARPTPEPHPPRSQPGELQDLPFLDLGLSRPKPQQLFEAADFAPWSKLVFQSYRHGRWEIYLADGDGSNQTRLTGRETADIHPQLNRGCTRIAFASNRAGNYEIYTMNLDGSGVTRRTINGADDVFPAWSPDGSKIAFQAYRDGQAEIYVMNADGSGQTRLTWNSGYDGEPNWSPDGSKIAFTSGSGGYYRIWVMNADGSDRTQLSNQPYSENPAWSPDGKQIAYDSDGDGDGRQELWLMNADGSSQREVYDPGDHFAMYATDGWVESWSPDGRYVAFTRISWIYYQGNWYWVEAYLDAWDTETESCTGLVGDDYDVEWHPAWQTTDVSAPTSSVYVLPMHSRNGLLVGWNGSDSGDAGIRSYDVQYRDGATGSWTDWQVETPEALASFSGTAGHTYYFRSRVRDNAHNVEAWPSGQGDAHTTLYTWLVDGTVLDNGDTPAVGEIINTTPGSSEANPTDSQGNYTVYVGESAITYTVTWEKSGYGELPITSFSPSQDAHVDAILPPADNIVLNWGFENGEFGPGGWLTSGIITPVVTGSLKHTGNYAALLGQQSAFASPWNVANSLEGEHAQLAVGENGAVHIVWSGLPFGTTENHEIYYARRGSDGAWSSPQNISQHDDPFGDIESFDPQVAVDGSGAVHVVWIDETPGYSDIYYARRGSDGTWSTPHNVSDDVERLHVAPQLAVDENGAVHIVWTYSNDTYYAQRGSDGAWSSPQNISNHYPFEDVESLDPQVAVDASGAAHMVWSDETPGNFDIYYARRGSDGVWSSPQNISNSPGYSSSPQLMVHGSGAVHVVWSDYNPWSPDIFYARRGSDGNWSSPQNLSNSPDGSSLPQLVVDGSGAVHVVWVGNNSGYVGDSSIYYTRQESNGNWSIPLNISTPLDSFAGSNSPRLAVDGSGTVHVIWLSGDYDPYYARRGSDGIWSRPQNIVNAEELSVDGLQMAAQRSGTVHVVWSESWRIYYVGPAFAEQTGDSSISQVVNVPATMANPALSFLFQFGSALPSGGGWFDVQVDDGGAATTLFSTTTSGDVWLHHWSDLSPWAGQTVTVTLNVHQVAGEPGAWAYLDEVTLGSTYPDLWVGAYGTDAFPGEQAVHTIRYGNRGGAAASGVRISATLPSELFFVDANPPPTPGTLTLLLTWEWDVGDVPAKSGPFTIVLTTTMAPTATMFSTLTSTAGIWSASPHRPSVPMGELETANNTAQAAFFVGRQIYLPLLQKNAWSGNLH